MPQLGETVTEGTVTRWLKTIGDRVEIDEPLLEVSTDKVDTEIPSAAAGVLSEILIPEGDTVPIGTALARIGDGAADTATATGTDRAAATTDPEEDPAEVPPAEDDETPAPEPVVDVRDAPPATLRTTGATGSATFLSPVVRRLLEEHDLHPSEVQATGAGGRLTAADVRAHARAHAPPPPSAGPSTSDGPPGAPGPSTPEAPESGPPTVSPPADSTPPADTDEVIPFSSIRRRTAAHMVTSLATSAHTLVAVEVDYHRVEQTRAVHKEPFREREGVGLSYLPFIARAVVDAIGEYPAINASVGDDELVVHHDINLGIAVDLDFDGLIVPVVRRAHHLRLGALTRAMADQAAKARAGSLAPDDVTGGTFTITNAGGYGTLLTTPIIAQPQVAILSTDGIAMRPAAVRQPGGAWGLTVHPLGNLALSFDHRAFDGAYASAFMARVREILQDRDWAAEVGT